MSGDEFSLTLLAPGGAHEIAFGAGTAVVRELRTRDPQSEAGFLLDAYGGSLGGGAWPSMEEEMRAFSAGHPEVLFRVNVKNPEYDSYANLYFLGGKMQSCPGSVVYEAFDAEKLKGDGG
jgi:hypothetical protein